MAKAAKQTSKDRNVKAKSKKQTGKDRNAKAGPDAKTKPTAKRFTRNALRKMTKDSLLVLCRQMRLDAAGLTKDQVVEKVLREQAEQGASRKAKAAGRKPAAKPERTKGASARQGRSGEPVAAQKPVKARKTSIREAVWALFDQHGTSDPKTVTLEMATEAARKVKSDSAFKASHRAFYARRWREARKGSVG